MPATVCVIEKSKLFYALLYFFLVGRILVLSFFRCLSPVCCLPVCLSVCVPVNTGVSYSESSIFDIPNGRSSQFFKKFLTIWTPSISLTLISGSFCLHFSGIALFFCFRASHLPTKRRVATVVATFYEEHFKCISSLCEVTSEKRFNIVKHMKRCPKIVDRKQQVYENRTCRHCGATSVRKCNCDRHIQKPHLNENETNHTRMGMMIWFFMTLKSFQRKLLIFIP